MVRVPTGNHRHNEKIITNSPVVAYYYLQKEVLRENDACEYDLGVTFNEGRLIGCIHL